MKRDRVLAAIAFFRLTKAALLILVGFGVLQLLRPEVAAHVRDWMRSLPLLLRYHPQRALGSPKHIALAAAAAFAYAALFLTEGIGLWLQKTWAEWLTIVATTSFIPFEIWEIVKKLTILRVGLLIANIAIVIYLLMLRLGVIREHRLRRVAR